MSVDHKRRRFAFCGILIALVVLCLLWLSGRRFSSDITDMLPRNSDAAGMLRLLAEENVSNKMTIELRLREGKEDSRVLTESVDALTLSLKHPDIKSVFSGLPLPSFERMSAAYTALPDLADDATMKEIAKTVNPESIKRTMRRNYMRLVAPEGIEAARFIENDPLGWNRFVLGKMRSFAKVVTYKTAPDTTKLIGPDRRRALVVLETNVPVVDGKRAAKLLGFLEECLKKLPRSIESRIVCGHKHTLGNERTIKRDILVVSIASIIIFSLLFIVVYQRSVQAFWIVLMPLIAVLCSVTLMSLLVDRISAFIIGLGGAMAGISVDYGIHVYSACCVDEENEVVPLNRMKRIKLIIRPLCAGAVTTMGIFLAFVFSDVTAYTQLGVFAMFCVAFSLGLALTALPLLLNDKVKPSMIHARVITFSKPVALWTVVIAGVLFLVAFILATNVSLDGSVISLDGAGDDVLRAEKEFNAYWSKTPKPDGRKTASSRREGSEQAGLKQHDNNLRNSSCEEGMPALLVIRGDSKEEVSRAAEELVEYAQLHHVTGFVSPVLLAPSHARMRRNLERWRNFWTPEKINEVASSIKTAGIANGFREDAFKNFSEWLRSSVGNTPSDGEGSIFDVVKKKLINKRENGVSLVSFMSDTPENLESIKKISKKLPMLRVISPRVLKQSIGDDVLGKLIKIGLTSVVIVLVIAVLSTAGLVTGLVALSPVVASVTLVCAAFAIAGKPLTIPGCAALIIVIGLSIDYGIFMVFSCFKGLRGDVMTSVALSAVTTMAGASTLLFASHPVMYDLGLTLLAGVAVSYIVASLFIPALSAVFHHSRVNNRYSD